MGLGMAIHKIMVRYQFNSTLPQTLNNLQIEIKAVIEKLKTINFNPRITMGLMSMMKNLEEATRQQAAFAKEHMVKQATLSILYKLNMFISHILLKRLNELTASSSPMQKFGLMMTKMNAFKSMGAEAKMEQIDKMVKMLQFFKKSIIMMKMMEELGVGNVRYQSLKVRVRYGVINRFPCRVPLP